MKKLSMLRIIGGAALLTAVPFSLQWSQKNVALSFDNAEARIVRAAQPKGSPKGISARSLRNRSGWISTTALQYGYSRAVLGLLHNVLWWWCLAVFRLHQSAALLSRPVAYRIREKMATCARSLQICSASWL
jgi:hypothetical protein